MLVVARVAELGKQVKSEETVLEMPWASSSCNQTQAQYNKVTPGCPVTNSMRDFTK